MVRCLPSQLSRGADRSRDMTPAHVVIALLVATTWGIGFVANAIALESFSPPLLVLIRFVLAVLPILFVPRPKLPWSTLIALGIFMFCGQFILLFFAYEAGMPAGLASVTTHTQALFTIIAATIVFREIPTRKQGFGVLVAFAGLACIAFSIGGELTALGLALTLGGAVSWAIGNTILKSVRDVDMFPLIIWMCIVPPLPSLLVSAALGELHTIPEQLLGATWQSWLAACYLGVIATTIAFGAWAYLLKLYPAVVVTPFALFAPVAGVLMSYLVLGETFGTLRGIGMTLVLCGLVITILAGRQRGQSIRRV